MALTAIANTYAVDVARTATSSISLTDQVRRRPNPNDPIQISVGRSGSSGRVRNPERDLWATVLLNLKDDIAEHGPNSKAHKMAINDLASLEYLTGCLGYPKGSAARLIDEAVGVWSRRQVLIREAV